VARVKSDKTEHDVAWERIFTREIIHAADCPFEEGDENADGHVECECYVTRLWDALDEFHQSLARRDSSTADFRGYMS
jgi:hypothetical protein